MHNDDRALFLLNKYGDDIYRFAFILTCNEDRAGVIMAEAFEYAAGNGLFSDKDKDDKKLLFSRVYKNAVKNGDPAVYDEEKYGKKSDTFKSIVSLPLKERAIRHLILYEDMEEKEAEKVISGR